MLTRLTYWMVFGFVKMVECIADSLIFWLPFYVVLKIAFYLSLAIPQTNVNLDLMQMADYIYAKYLKPLIVDAEGSLMENHQVASVLKYITQE